ncbi:MAG: hypothetical protein G01um10145_318 [Microgenomates group bacterium Gr01-1014_5]|nr:MAG: hypothetical protein G01um10145_318 [Microgenomates group bacterium Gr01-1014_5]
MKRNIEAPVWLVPVVGHGIPTGDRCVPKRNDNRGPADVLTPLYVYDPRTNDYVEKPTPEPSPSN